MSQVQISLLERAEEGEEEMKPKAVEKTETFGAYVVSKLKSLKQSDREAYNNTKDIAAFQKIVKRWAEEYKREGSVKGG